MGTYPARKPRSPSLQILDAEAERAARLARIGDIIGLYRDLTTALDRVSDDELGRSVTAARAGERGLANWGRQVEAFRHFKRRFEAGMPPVSEVREATDVHTEHQFAWADEEPGTPPFLWEALAFVIGFIVSFLVT